MEDRQWIRLTRRCNNRCLFCHDIERQDGTVVPLDEIRAAIRAGRERGAGRLVLSGGEPTIHPRFLEVVALGRGAGYRWVQVISNGRMFAYEKFAAAAAAAGLDEVTLSIHGHTPEVHDALVGSKGAFAQVIRGLENLQRTRRVVSIDIVACRPNVRHLADIVKFLLDRGIREFDLLHLVPFGRAFEEQREMLEFDPLEERKHILNALAFAARPGVHMWTNRWPAPLLEGAEHLMQDPHKIMDELRGMADDFRTLLDTGKVPACHGERCPRCFLREFCDALAVARARLVSGEFAVVVLDAAAAPNLPASTWVALERQSKARFRLHAPDAEAALAALACSPRHIAAELELDLDRFAAPKPALVARTRRVVVRCDEGLTAALALRGIDIEVPLERATATLARRALDTAGDRVVLRAQGYALLSEAIAADLAPAEIAALAGGARAEGVARCLAPRAVALPAVLDAEDLDPCGMLDLFRFAERWIRNGYRTRSLRCGGCAEADKCDGAHINVVRAHGFGWMHPKFAGAEA